MSIFRSLYASIIEHGKIFDIYVPIIKIDYVFYK